MTVRGLSRVRQLDPHAAIQALGHMEAQEHVLDSLSHYLGHADVAVRVEAVRALAGMGARTASWLVPALADDNSTVRREAAAALGKFGPDAVYAVPALAPLLEDDDVRVRTAATLTLGRIGRRAAPAIPALMRVLMGPHLILSRLAAQSLSRVGPAAVPALTRALVTADNYARREAAWALGEIGPAVAAGRDLESLEQLSVAVEEPAAVQVCAAADRGTVPIDLGEVVAVPEVPTAVLETLAAAHDPLTALVVALRDADAKVREAAGRALTRIRGQ
jgi:HEAT repeat protein